MSFPAGSGVLRPSIINLSGGSSDPGSCVTAYYNEDAFNRNSSASGPFNTGATSPWGSNWENSPDRISGTLSFPGTDYIYSGSNHINRLSPFLPRKMNDLRISLTAYDPGTEPANTVGIQGTGVNDFVDPYDFIDGTWEAGNYNESADDLFIYAYFNDVYNSTLTGGGTYSYAQASHGSGATTSISGGIATVSVTNDYFSQKLKYTGNSGVNQNVVVGTFQTKFATAGGATKKVHLTYGAAIVDLLVSNNQVDVTTGSGSSGQSFSFSANTWYVTTVLLNLPDNEVTVRVYEESNPSGAIEITQSANGESTTDGTYLPYIAIRVEAFEDDPWTVYFRSVISNAYYSPSDVATDPFTTTSAPSHNGWGTPWTLWRSNTVVSPGDPGMLWSAGGGFGSIEVNDQSLLEDDFIAKPLPAGDAEVWFSVRNYPVGVFSILEIWFHRTGVANQKRDGVMIGTTLSVEIGATGGSSYEVDIPDIVDGSPINVRIAYSPPSISAWVWQEGTTMPTKPTATTAMTSNSWRSDLATELIIWPDIFSTGQRLDIGGIDAGLGSGLPVFAGYTPVQNAAPIIDITDIVGPTPAGGVISSWPFADPGDGRAYGGSWGVDTYTHPTAPFGVGAPEYFAEVIWGQFGDLGPGVPESASQQVADVAIPKYYVDGVEAEFTVIVSGELGLELQGHSSGSGEAEIICELKTYKYDVNATTRPPPPRSDYFIQNGTSEAVFSAVGHEGGTTQWQNFRVKCASDGGTGGINIDASGNIHFIWGTEVLNPHQTIRDAGPFDQNGFLTQHDGAVKAHVRNVRYEIEPHLVPVIGIPAPCEPLGAGSPVGGVVVPPQILGNGTPR